MKRKVKIVEISNFTDDFLIRIEKIKSAYIANHQITLSELRNLTHLDDDDYLKLNEIRRFEIK